MNGDLRHKLNPLLNTWPSGTLMTHAALSKRGVYQQLVAQYTKSGWLVPLGHGVFKKAGDTVDYLSAVLYLQTELNAPVHLAAKTALSLQGVAHFLSSQQSGVVYLFGASGYKLPAWLVKPDKQQAVWGVNINYFTPKLFSKFELGLQPHSLVKIDGQVVISSLERAILEVLYLIPKAQSLVEAKYLMEGLMTLRPDLLQQLLEQCQSIKVKRLFCFLADLCQLPCFSHLDLTAINLGSGKRVIAGGGHFVSKYQLSIPKQFVTTFKDEFTDYE